MINFPTVFGVGSFLYFVSFSGLYTTSICPRVFPFYQVLCLPFKLADFVYMYDWF